MAVAGVFIATTIMNKETMIWASHTLDLIDMAFFIPLNIVMLVTGVIFCSKTNWGYTKHGWVTVKLIITPLIILIATFVQWPAMLVTQRLITQHGNDAWDLAEFQAARITQTTMLTFFLALIMVAFVLSLTKPHISVPLTGRHSRHLTKSP